jgi:[acyl-carrier-protein] S-malonyltransferase
VTSLGGDAADTAIGFVRGGPVSRRVLDRRLAELRGGPLNAALPVPGTAEDRQLARWLTQVILTEVLCEAEAATLGLAPLEDAPLDRTAAVELGAVNAAAYDGSPWVRAVFEHVAATAEIPPAWRPRAAPAAAARTLLVSHRLFPGRRAAEEATAADLLPLGEVTLGSLPAALADAIRARPYGALVGPVLDSFGWHVAVASAQLAQPPEPRPEALIGAARRLAFARWLDEARAAHVRLVPGLEHPGDPRQPDNHHKHG